MNYFKLINKILAETLLSWHKSYGLTKAAAKKEMAYHLKQMKDEWESGDRPTINYEKPACRLAYLFRHVAANANLFELVLRKSPTLRELVTARLSASEFRIAAFGGGPGTELLGLLKHISKTSDGRHPCRIQFTIVDRVQEWADNWGRIAHRIRTDEVLIKECGHITIDSTFLSLDLSDPRPFKRYEYLLRQDIYVFNYVLSEMIDDADGLQQTISTLASRAEVGSAFVVIDRNQKAVEAIACEVLQSAGLSVEDVSITRTNMDKDERCVVLDEYKKLIEEGPRAQWRSFWVIGLKK